MRDAHWFGLMLGMMLAAVAMVAWDVLLLRSHLRRLRRRTTRQLPRGHVWCAMVRVGRVAVLYETTSMDSGWPENADITVEAQ